MRFPPRMWKSALFAKIEKMIYTKKYLEKELIASGFNHHDTVLVHSSMKSIGKAENGADGVLDVLMDFFSQEGLLVFPALSYHIFNDPEMVYSPETTASVVGLLPEMFRKRAGVVRSKHPTHSVAGFGTEAETFCAGHEKFNTPCARTSPWGRLYDRQAKILFIGTKSIGCCTYFHGVEEWLPVPGMFSSEPYMLKCRFAGKTQEIIPTYRHINHHNQYYWKVTDILFGKEALAKVRFGDAECFLMDARKSGDIVLDILRKDPGYFTKA